MKHIASRFNVGGVLTLLILLSACSEQVPANLEQPVEAASPAPTVIERIVRVTLTEGTNLALTVDPVSGDRVVSPRNLVPVAGRREHRSATHRRLLRCTRAAIFC